MKPHFNKLFVALGLIFVIAFNQANAQTVKWDSTYRPPKYVELTAKFKADVKSKKDYIFLGNSITAGTDWAKLLNLPQAKNRGISGDGTFGVLDRLQDVIDGKPAKIFILIGVNDVSRNIPDSVILGNYKKSYNELEKVQRKLKYISTRYYQ